MLCISLNISLGFFKGLTDIKNAWRSNANFRVGVLIIIATIPAVIVGLLVHEHIGQMSNSRIGANLMMMGGILLYTRKYDRNDNNKKSIADIAIGTAIIIGIAQAAAIFPGISRSGITISVALFLGIARKDAGVFSFLLSIPVIVGAIVLEIKNIANIDLAMLVVGFTVAFISGLFALKVLIRFLKNGRLFYFSFYCIIVGLAMFLYFNRF